MRFSFEDRKAVYCIARAMVFADGNVDGVDRVSDLASPGGFVCGGELLADVDLISVDVRDRIISTDLFDLFDVGRVFPP